jgi:hypothetical protein
MSGSIQLKADLVFNALHVMTRMEAEAAPGHRHSGKRRHMMRSVSFVISKYFRRTSIFRGMEMNEND